MKKVKIAFWIIILVFAAVLIYQNKQFFLSEHSLGINLYFAEKNTPNLPNALLFAAFFLAGWLIAYSFSLFDRFKASKTIKGLKNQVASYQKNLDQMKQEVEALKAMPAEEVPEMPGTIAGENPSSESETAQTPQSSS